MTLFKQRVIKLTSTQKYSLALLFSKRSILPPLLFGDGHLTSYKYNGFYDIVYQMKIVYSLLQD